MLDARLIREDPERVRSAMRSRSSAWNVDVFLAADVRRREVLGELESLQAQRNESSKAIGALMKQGATADAEAAKEQVRAINEQIATLESAQRAAEAAVTDLLATAPNLPDASVPIGADETENVELKRWGTPRDFDFAPQAHWDLGPRLSIIDFERAVKLAESRFVLLAGAGARLERALINFMLDTHADAGFKEWWPPALANAETLYGTGQLPKFEDDLYKTATTSDANEGCSLGDKVCQTAGRLYLIPTAEVVLTNIHRGEVLEVSQLPLRYAAYTPCFREEAGSAGRDTRGMIRVHQFDKVEMVKFATPETSADELEHMTLEAEKILELLELPYRRVVLCTGDMGFGATKTYDLEVWMPGYQDYREISSCSNCGDFQARRAQIKYRDPTQFKGSRLVHTLNGSGLAVGRTLAALLENYQQADGSVTIPEVLRPYMGGLEQIIAEDN
ncbi:MAG: serine--tRNA ligase [Actinomycetia bacterium]|nr:serine--tRNA ligase [Actinomycetes bacterium]